MGLVPLDSDRHSVSNAGIDASRALILSRIVEIRCFFGKCACTEKTRAEISCRTMQEMRRKLCSGPDSCRKTFWDNRSVVCTDSRSVVRADNRSVVCAGNIQICRRCRQHICCLTRRYTDVTGTLHRLYRTLYGRYRTLHRR